MADTAKDKDIKPVAPDPAAAKIESLEAETKAQRDRIIELEAQVEALAEAQASAGGSVRVETSAATTASAPLEPFTVNGVTYRWRAPKFYVGGQLVTATDVTPDEAATLVAEYPDLFAKV